MNLITISRKPYLAFFLAIAVLFVSCEQYDQPIQKTQNQFDYTAFENFKNNSSLEKVINIINQKNLIKLTSTNLEINREILKIVNTEMGSDIILPDKFMTLSTNLSAGSLYSIGLDNGWINDYDVIKTKKFADELQTYGFTRAVKNYENKVLTLNLSQEEFLKEVAFLNIMKSIEYQNPDLFKSKLLYKQSNIWRCILALIAFGVTLVNLSSCVLIFPCLLAYTLFIGASLSVAEHCF